MFTFIIYRISLPALPGLIAEHNNTGIICLTTHTQIPSLTRAPAFTHTLDSKTINFWSQGSLKHEDESHNQNINFGPNAILLLPMVGGVRKSPSVSLTEWGDVKLKYL